MRLHVPIGLRWGDLDAYGHVNNAEMLRLLEEARIQAFWSADHEPPGPGEPAATAVLDGRPGSATLSLIARQEIEYLAPIPYLRQPIDVTLWIGRIGGADLQVCYEVYSPVGYEPRVFYVRAATTIVLVDAATDRPRRIDARERAAWLPYLEETVTFSMRR